MQRLRQKGEPIQLFGETNKERRMRLRSLELSEEHGVARPQRQQEIHALDGKRTSDGTGGETIITAPDKQELVNKRG